MPGRAAVFFMKAACVCRWESVSVFVWLAAFRCFAGDARFFCAFDLRDPSVVDGDLDAAEADSRDFSADDFDPIFVSIFGHEFWWSVAKAPAAMEESLPWAEDDFVGGEADEDDEKHERDDLIHRVKFASVVEQVAESV